MKAKQTNYAFAKRTFATLHEFLGYIYIKPFFILFSHTFVMLSQKHNLYN